MTHHYDAARDYILAGTLTTSPIWAHYLADINAVLTLVGLVIGLALGARRLWRDIKSPGKE